MAEVALRELDEIVQLVERCDPADLDRPTDLPGWRAEDLVRHITGTAARQAEAYHRVRFGIAEQPGEGIATGTATELPPRLAAAAAHLAAGVRAVEGTDATAVPLPWGVLPPPLAAFVILVEYGVHRYDLEQALGGGALAPDVADAMCDLLGLMLPSLASPTPPPVGAIRFEPTGRGPVTLRWHDGSWSAGESIDEPPSVLRGPTDAVALFVAGRIGVDDDRLEVEDSAHALAHFKRLFPGP